MAKVNKPMTEAQWEKQWQAERDAEALKRAAELQKDPSRRKAAEAHIKKQLTELQKQQQSMAAVISKPAAKSTSRSAGKGKK